VRRGEYAWGLFERHEAELSEQLPLGDRERTDGQRIHQESGSAIAKLGRIEEVV